MVDLDDDRPMRKVSARRRAEQQWKMTEPWRVKEKHRRYRNILIVFAIVIGIAIYLSTTNTTTALAPNDVIAVGQTGTGQLEMHFVGCQGEGLEWIALYPTMPQITPGPFQGNAIWLAQAKGSPVVGVQQFNIGTPPQGFRNLVDLSDISQYSEAHNFWVEAVTSTRTVRFPFSKSLLGPDFVVSATGRFALPTFMQQSAHNC
jgi:hypothetical protein